MAKEVNLAVIGAGYWGRKVTQEYIQLAKNDSDFSLVYVCDLDEKNLGYCRDVLRIGREKLSSDFEAVLKSTDIDAVHICTPNETHNKIGLHALNQGKNVLLEKPLATSAADAWGLCTVAERARLCLQVGHIYRFNNAVKEAKRLIDDEFFGDLYYLNLQWTTQIPSPLGRDIIFDLGPHPVDILNYLLNRWPDKVTCKGKSYRRPSLEEVAHFDFDFDKRLMSHVELSWLEPGKVRQITIVGERRSAKVDCLRQVVEIYEDNDGPNSCVNISPNNTIFDEVKHFVNSIRDENNHKNPGPIGAGNVCVLESLKKSLHEEQTVKTGLSP
jgi:predicted dehydrogenase